MPPGLVPIGEAISDTLIYAPGQVPSLPLIAQLAALGQSTMSVQDPISSPMARTSPPFNFDLDSGDLDLLKKKLGDSQDRQKKILFE